MDSRETYGPTTCTYSSITSNPADVYQVLFTVVGHRKMKPPALRGDASLTIITPCHFVGTTRIGAFVPVRFSKGIRCSFLHYLPLPRITVTEEVLLTGAFHAQSRNHRHTIVDIGGVTYHIR